MNINNFNNINNNINNLMIFKEKPPLVGLKNIKSNYFMNSTLQCLSQTKLLTNYFLDKNNEQFIKNNNNIINTPINNKLSIVYLDLIKQLWINQDCHNIYEPNSFKNTIINMKSLFASNEVCEAKDLIIFILQQLHKELRKSININLNKNNKNIEFNF